MTRDQALRILAIEREYQVGKWKDFDVKWHEADWLVLLEKYVEKAKEERVLMPHAQKEDRLLKNLVMIAAIGVSALEHLFPNAPDMWRHGNVQ